ncbi:MAG: twin-arginine translocase subunit TatC [Myxococcota bacterium]
MSDEAPKPAEIESSRMSLMDHLEELRRRLLYIVVVLVVATFASFSFAPQLFDLLREPLEAVTRTRLQVLSPLELFVTYLKLAMLAGIFVTAPWSLFQLWLFVSPGLYRREKRWITPFIVLGTLFFFAGGLFAFELVLPMGFRYLAEMVPETIETNYSVSLYYSLVVRMILAFGVVFQLPLIMWVLSAAGIASPAAYSRFRKYWLIAAFVIGGILTPPDPFTQIMMAVPLLLFYELGVWGARIMYRQRTSTSKTP